MRLKDETGRRFGLLVAVRKVASTSYRTEAHWLCQCDCGRTTTVRANTLRRATTRSCGCQRGRKMNGC